MRSVIARLALVCLAALLAAGVSAQEKKDEWDKYKRSDAPPTVPPPVQGQAMKDILIRFVDEASHHFGLARERFLKNDYAQSAAEIRKGAAFVKLEMARATDEGKKALDGATSRLETLADNVERESVSSVDEINAALAQAEQALAFHHVLKAEKSWQANDYSGVGHDLKAASMSLENSLKYVGGKVEAETAAAIKDAKKIGQDLIEGNRPPDERIGTSIEALSSKVDEVGEKLAQPKK